MPRVSYAESTLFQELARKPTMAEIAERARLSISEVKLTLQARRMVDTLSLERPVEPWSHYSAGQREEMCLGDILEDKSGFGDTVEYDELAERVEAALAHLGKRERRILELRYGIGDEPGRTLAKVAAEFDLTRERIRQIEVKAKRKLAPMLETAGAL